jgi:hypothetical protein
MTPTDKARDAAVFASDLAFRLLASSTPEATPRDQRLDHITKAFVIWPSLCKRMAELAELCPNCAVEGQTQAAKLSDIAERVG